MTNKDTDTNNKNNNKNNYDNSNDNNIKNNNSPGPSGHERVRKRNLLNVVC